MFDIYSPEDPMGIPTWDAVKDLEQGECPRCGYELEYQDGVFWCPKCKVGFDATEYREWLCGEGPDLAWEE